MVVVADLTVSRWVMGVGSFSCLSLIVCFAQRLGAFLPRNFLKHRREQHVYSWITFNQCFEFLENRMERQRILVHVLYSFSFTHSLTLFAVYLDDAIQPRFVDSVIRRKPLAKAAIFSKIDQGLGVRGHTSVFDVLQGCHSRYSHHW